MSVTGNQLHIQFSSDAKFMKNSNTNKLYLKLQQSRYTYTQSYTAKDQPDAL